MFGLQFLELYVGRAIKEKDAVILLRNIKSTYGEIRKKHKIQMNIVMGNSCLLSMNSQA